MARRASVTVLGSHVVKPAGEQAHDGPLDMTTWDQLFGVVHNKTALLYNNPSSSQDCVVETLLGSLGRALAQFSPFAGAAQVGRQGTPPAGDRVQRGGSRGGGSRVRRGDELVPRLHASREHGASGPGSGLRATSRGAADSAGAAYEVPILARGEAMKEAPSLLYRAMFRERERHNNGRQLSFSDHVEFQDLPTIVSSGEEDGIEEWKKETVKLALPFTKAQLDALKKDASSRDNGDAISPSFSRYEVLTAHIWRYVATNDTVISNKHKETHSNNSFTESDLWQHGYYDESKEPSSNPLGFACGKLRETINNVDEDYIWSNFELLEKQDDLSSFMKDASVASKILNGKSYNGNPNLKVTSWLSLPIHDLDFGFGDIIEIIPLVRDIDGSTILLPDLNNDGSIIVLLCLQMTHVDEFKKHFYKDMNLY
ncbi:hypothetical protein V2J09_012962 [Rumex salicifolius]